MKNLHYLSTQLSCLLLISLTMTACKDEYEHGSIDADSVAPQAIENVEYTPVNGGFDISYDLPKDRDLLFVKAVYKNNDNEDAEVRTSIYDNKIQVLGFGDTDPKTIMLYAVDRAGNVSPPVKMSGEPLIPPVKLIEASMAISADFGGARFKWENETKTPVAIDLLGENEEGELVVKNTVYTEQSEASEALRGYEPEKTHFAAVLRDRYNNISDTIYPQESDKMLVPLFEEKIDPERFIPVHLSDDANWEQWGARYSNLYDGNTRNFVHTYNESFPLSYTVDLAAKVKLSRLVLLGRQSHSRLAFNNGNAKYYTIYGALDLPEDDGDLSKWIKIRDVESIKPSGLPRGDNTDGDVAAWRAGEETSFEDAPVIRYFRIVFKEAWGAGFIFAADMSLYGQYVDE